jgi:hypothetical protein
MPPETGHIQRKQPGVLVKTTDCEERILGMFSADGVGFALAESDWDAQEEVERLVSIVRAGDSSYAEKIAAIRTLNQRIREVAELNGLIVKGSYHAKADDGHGRTAEVIQTASRLLTTVRDRRPDDTTGPFAGRTREPLDEDIESH